MFTKVLPGKTKDVLAILGSSGALPAKTYLAGGTALALQLGHRISYDLDFYTPIKFEEGVLKTRLEEIGFKEERTAWQTLIGEIQSVAFSIFYYQYPLLEKKEAFELVPLASKKDIAAMKIGAVSSRGTKRDFFDLYLINKKVASLEECLKLYDKKFKNLSDVLPFILKSLTFFEDAERDTMPSMLINLTWDEVKNHFSKTVPPLARKLFQ